MSNCFSLLYIHIFMVDHVFDSTVCAEFLRRIYFMAEMNDTEPL